MKGNQIYITVKMLGKRRPVIEKQAIILNENFLEAPNLQNFLQLVVAQEVAAYNERISAKSLLPYLDNKKIAEMAAHGKVDFGAQYNTETVALEQAIATALQAFEDGLFMVLIDGTICKQLDQPLQFKENSEVVFLRLVALAGGYF